MLHRIVQTIALAAALCCATPAVADELCAVESSVRHIDRPTRFRATLSMLVPSVYATWQARASRSLEPDHTKQRGSAPTRLAREIAIEEPARGGWEIGIAWNPVRIIERSRRLRRMRRRRARRHLGPPPIWCRPRSTPSETSDVPRRFERRLERTISREKRDALEAILD